MRREDFLGPLFNGGAEGRKKIGLYALRTIGTVRNCFRGSEGEADCANHIVCALVRQASLALHSVLW